MRPAPNHRIKLVALAGLVALAAIVLLLWPARPAAGGLALSVTLANGQGVSELRYHIHGAGLEPRRGGIPVADPTGTTAATVDDLPAGSGYQIELSAASPDGRTCASRSTFDVVADRTTALAVHVRCRDRGPMAAFLAARKATMATVAATASAQPPAPTVEVPPECAACEQENIASGQCEPDSGCDGLTAEDQRLCLDLLNCMRATGCWVKDPLDCLCGTVDYVECTRRANGLCRAEMQAATRTTDPVKNGTLFYDPNVPAGRANRLVSCDREKCLAHCSLD